MAKTKRKKLSAKVFTIIISSLLAVLIAFAIALPAVLVNNFDAVMRDFFGTAGRKGGTVGGNEVTDKLDKEYNKISDKEGMTKDKLDAYEKQFVRDAGAEGYVLLKNDNDTLPLAAGTTVSIFSHSSVDILAGGTGSGVSYVSSNLKEAFAANGCSVNETLWNFYSSGAGSKYKRGAGAVNFGGSEDWSINECPLSVLNDNNVTASANGTQAMFVISRTGGEGRDLARYMGAHTNIEKDKDKHYLEPDSVELEIIKYLDDHFQNVIIVVNTNNAFELGWIEDYHNISAVLWAPGGGGETANSIADVLTGKVAPSGRLVDTFAYDAFSSPAMQNMGEFLLTVNGQGVGDYNNSQFHGLSYDEGIYVGYKYYETRYFDKVMGQGNTAAYDYAADVQYPYGYGMSYTTFTWSDFEMTQPNEDGVMEVKVKVTNDSSTVKAKEVVQVYANVPYTDFDKTNKIEKSAVSLVGFAKTGLLEPGADETVTIPVKVSDLISYDDVVNKTYILEQGDYNITAARNAHEAANNFLAKNGKTTADGMTADGDVSFVDTYNVATTDTETYSISSNKKKITNVFGADGLGDDTSIIARDKYLTRGNWTESFPVRHGTESNVASEYSERNGHVMHWEVPQSVIDKLKLRKTAEAANSPVADETVAKTYREYGQAKKYELIDLRGAAYDDPRWEELINQMTTSEVGTIIMMAGYKTDRADSINKPKAVDLDGPSGLNNMVAHTPYSITYPAEVNIAASWSTKIAYDWGEAVGMDGLRSNVLCSGWYAPALNIHRTPFAGRNFEYFSEDSFISGELATYAIQGAGSMGMYSYIKHFALNDQENFRLGVATFANEQTIREIYLKPFQMAIENSGTATTKYYEYNETTGEYTAKTAQTPIATAVMSSFNRIGYTWAGGDYRLLTQILREEWGFNGAVLTDYFNGGYMDVDQFLRAGGDLALTQYIMGFERFTVNSDIRKYYAQQSIKHTLYMVVNSNAMNGYVHGIAAGAEPFAYYYLILIAVGVIAVGLTAWGVTAIVLRWKKEKSGALEGVADGESEQTESRDTTPEAEE